MIAGHYIPLNDLIQQRNAAHLRDFVQLEYRIGWAVFLPGVSEGAGDTKTGVRLSRSKISYTTGRDMLLQQWGKE